MIASAREDKTKWRPLGALLATLVFSTFLVGCETVEMAKVGNAETSDQGYAAYSEMTYSFTDVRFIRQECPWARAISDGIGAEWAGNFQSAEAAYREGVANPGVWQCENGAQAKAN